MSRLGLQDVAAILRGLQNVVNATVKLQESQIKQVWNNSSLKEMAEDLRHTGGKTIMNTLNSGNVQTDITKQLTELMERASMVGEGVKAYVKYSGGVIPQPDTESFTTEAEINELNLYSAVYPQDSQSVSKFDSDAHKAHNDAKVNGPSEKVVNNASSVNLGTENLKQNDSSQAPGKAAKVEEVDRTKTPENDTKQKPLDKVESRVKTETADVAVPESAAKPSPNSTKKPDATWVKKRQTLSSSSRQRKVPSSRLGRLMSFGGLAAGLGVGAAAEFTRRTLGLKDKQPGAEGGSENTFLTPANAERIVNTLCKVRGAALKIGQILSIQDSSIISPPLQKAFERVRQSADFMPSWQVEKVLQSELGPEWKTKVQSFEEKPFAAASIGQVHLAVLPNKQEVAMKIQYPGVAEGIQSDIDNLVGVLKVWNIFPEGIFIDNIVEVAKRELAWEVDYVREAACTKKFKELLKPYPDYIVPDVIDNLSTKQVFSTTLIDGMPVDKCVDLNLEIREHICFLIMQLCLKELFEFRYMQTDPNWSNFFYNPETRKMALLDFGASREYSKEFMDKYIQVIRGAADEDRQKVLKLSKELGFFTGYESKIMEEAHVDAVMILGEVFRSQTPFDFGAQNTTREIQQLVPTMIKHRLCPPPEEIYSLHRKLSGVFLLCSKLQVKMLCRPMFEEAYANYMKS
ncbi:hypothetical protein R5R35_012206 [Gryllus longicercus]|uniref:ABC1 atypical kinase-like domain-containing protein n=1 Tax=Gryllus longicercus TaxID=2509291 RepID=A0AAN9UYZ0_9ORTH